MRKVSFQYWIFPTKKQISQGREVEIKAGHWSEPKEGWFLGWGNEVHQDINNIVPESVAIVEDINTGQVHKVDPNKMKFIQPDAREVIFKGMGIIYRAPEYHTRLQDFIKANSISELLIYGKGWNTVEHFHNRLEVLKAVTNCWIDKMPVT